MCVLWLDATLLSPPDGAEIGETNHFLFSTKIKLMYADINMITGKLKTGGFEFLHFIKLLYVGNLFNLHSCKFEGDK